MKTIRILILEDDLKTLSFLLLKLNSLEEELLINGRGDIAVTVLSEYTQVEEYINKSMVDFDVILLDRDCKAGGSFHILNFERFGLNKIISISSTPQWNKEAVERGVKDVIHKDYEELDKFSDKVIDKIKEIIKIKI